MYNKPTWQPSASIVNLLKRAKIISTIRNFFLDRCILEVDTPSISQETITDTHLIPFQTNFMNLDNQQNILLYMITSPEHHMKRLLAAGSGPIYQLGKAFRNEEYGQYHNPEFSILEWYRPHYDMYSLMNEVDDLMQIVLQYDHSEILSYQEAFIRYLGIDPLCANKVQLNEIAITLNLNNITKDEKDIDTLLQLLFTFGVEPNIGHNKPTFIYHYPASQASSAQISSEDQRVAERFEVYYKNIELGNGFHELNNAHEQRMRFEEDNRKRAALGLTQYPLDEKLLGALEHGLPDCSGVAIGIDRLIMLALNEQQLSTVIAFNIDRS
ncbi:Elongation factor P--(R)-beta-lysine ligase [Candidatus Profftia lariciata]|uniref:elongation factor P--(R)-beta-lysine ligase n=1 Tax=Candidatus Profftia lariciata TaxID=1987921 RepID=UPI001D008BB3|nr:elongation factor P--(R)-beta-lysine ligase [Candidatus Profftia lariciata]UDG81296.1 Elongation factor P--(R)-beta-lysine ligase [Candidatus Profftia lariciata]